MYELQTNAGWGVAGNSMTSAGSTAEKICLVGYDATH